MTPPGSSFRQSNTQTLVQGSHFLHLPPVTSGRSPVGIPLHGASSDGATLLGKEVPISGSGRGNVSPGTQGTSLESLSWEGKHVTITKRPYEMWDGQL